MFYLSVACLVLSSTVAGGNLVGVLGAMRRKRNGIDRGFSTIPICSLLFAIGAWLFSPEVIGFLAFLPAVVDPANWSLACLPFLLIRELRDTDNVR